jgi:hypothetical protein
MPAIAPPGSPLEPKEKKKQQDMAVMDAVRQKGVPKQTDSVEQAKERLRRIIVQTKVNPQEVIQAGKYASMALKDKTMYSMAIQVALKEGLVQPEEIQPGVIDYQLIAKAITAGKLTEQLVKEGKV